jgi:hypothetical protein
VFALVACAGALCWQILIPPVVGLADNFDFARIMGPLGIQHVSKEHDDQFFYYANVRFERIKPYYRIGYISSEFVPAELASLLARWIDKTGGFDIRVLGCIHAFLLLIAIAVALDPRLQLRRSVGLLLAAAALLVFCDVAYVAPMNSFYSATASFLSLILAAAILLQGGRRERPSAGILLAFWVVAFAFVLSKPQESVTSPIVAAVGLRWSWTFFDRRWRPHAAVAAILLCVAAIGEYVRIPADHNDASVFHSIFLEMLPNSRDRGADLDALGLPASWTRYSGVSAYQAGTPFADPDFRRRFTERVSHSRIALFYALRPVRFGNLLHRAARRAAVMRPHHLGNFEKSVGMPPRAMSRAFALWSGARERLGSGTPALIVANLISGIGIAALQRMRGDTRRARFAGEVILALVAVAVLEFLVSVTGEGITDVVRHLFAFQAAFDLLLVVNAVFVVGLLERAKVSSANPRPQTVTAVGP